MKTMNKSFIATIEDELIKNFDHFNRTSSVYLMGEKHDIEVSYNTLTGTLEAEIYDEDSKSYPNVKKLIEDSISTDKILNEIGLEEMKDDEEHEAELDNRRSLNRLHGVVYPFC